MPKFNRKHLADKVRSGVPSRNAALLIAFELVGLYAVLIGLGYIFSGKFSFAEATVHPLWLMVLFMAAHYGLGWGLVAACVASVSHVFTVPAGAGFAQLPLMVIEKSGPLVAAWLLAAALVGAYRDRAERAVLAAQSRQTTAETERDHLARYAETLAQENSELRVVLARGGRPVDRLTVAGSKAPITPDNAPS